MAQQNQEVCKSSLSRPLQAVFKFFFASRRWCALHKGSVGHFDPRALQPNAKVRRLHECRDAAAGAAVEVVWVPPIIKYASPGAATQPPSGCFFCGSIARRRSPGQPAPTSWQRHVTDRHTPLGRRTPPVLTDIGTAAASRRQRPSLDTHTANCVRRHLPRLMRRLSHPDVGVGRAGVEV